MTKIHKHAPIINALARIVAENGNIVQFKMRNLVLTGLDYKKNPIFTINISEI